MTSERLFNSFIPPKQISGYAPALFVINFVSWICINICYFFSSSQPPCGLVFSVRFCFLAYFLSSMKTSHHTVALICAVTNTQQMHMLLCGLVVAAHSLKPVVRQSYSLMECGSLTSQEIKMQWDAIYKNNQGFAQKLTWLRGGVSYREGNEASA